MTTPTRKLPLKKVGAPPPPEYALPTEPKAIDADIGHYLWLFYGREKIGKTKIASSFPGAIFFSTEPGDKGLSIFAFNEARGGVTTWDVFRAGVDLLVAGNHSFRTVVIDTADRAYDMCLDWVCANRGIDYPGTDAAGDQDYGKSWRAVKVEFTEQIYRLVQAGMGIVFTSHSREMTINPKSSDKYDRIIPSMSGQARVVIEALVDFFFYCEYVREQRVLICEGDETIWAGARATLGGTFPRFLPMLKEGMYNLLTRAFHGEDVGLNAAELMPSKESSKTGKAFLQHARMEEARNNAKEVPAPTAIKSGPRKATKAPVRQG